MSIKAALDDAVKNHDLNSFLDARDIELKTVKNPMVNLDRGMINLMMVTDGKSAQFKYPANRPLAVKAIKKIDKTQLQSFDSVKNMESHLNDLYRPYAYVSIKEYASDDNGLDLKRLSVANMHVDADLRSMGIGRHLRATILKFADEHNYVVTGTPTDKGDGTIDRNYDNEEEFQANALAHKARLEKFYLDFGYEYNYAYSHQTERELWSGELKPKDSEWEKKLNPSAAEFLRLSGVYVRWPNNKVPQNWSASSL
jgi:GNAT superfamily N-acetyltransferase